MQKHVSLTSVQRGDAHSLRLVVVIVRRGRRVRPPFLHSIFWTEPKVCTFAQKYAIRDTVCDHPDVLLTSVSETEQRPPKWALTFAASSQFWHISLTFTSHQRAQYPAGSPPFLLSDTATMQPSSFSRPLTTLKKCFQLPTACPRALSLSMTD